MEKNKGKVTGIGGIFFKCKDPEAMKTWYREKLGLATDAYGTVFQFYNPDQPNVKGYLQWSPMKESTKYFDPSDKPFMINYRVENIENLLENLKAKGVHQVGEIQSFEYGKFAHILDMENNKIELWEPVDREFEKLLDNNVTK